MAGAGRSSRYGYDAAPAGHGLQGAGTVHHIAWAVAPDTQPAWRSKITEGGFNATELIDRTYFRSVYFREPSGVLFEIATEGPGFTVDEAPEHLGERLCLPPSTSTCGRAWSGCSRRSHRRREGWPRERRAVKYLVRPAGTVLTGPGAPWRPRRRAGAAARPWR